MITALLLILSGWVSSLEAAFFALKAEEIERWRTSSSKREQIVSKLLKDPRLLLTVLTTCKYALLVAAAVITMASFAWNAEVSASRPALLIWMVLLALGFGLFGVILAKIYGSAVASRIVSRNARAVAGLVALLRPIVAPILRMSLSVERILLSKSEQKSVEEFTSALQLATIDNEPVEGEKEILEGIVNFGTLRVKQVMRPRTEISFVDVSVNFHELMEFIRKSGYSRIPVCDGSLDNIIGLLYIKDLLPFLGEGRDFDWRKLIRSGYFEQESKKIDFLLKDFQEKRVHIALVVNQQGRTLGLITLEDIIEEILGDINDEFDEIGSRYQRLDEHTYVFDGKTSVYEFCRVLNVNPGMFYPLRGINESLSGVILQHNRTMPEVGEKITMGPLSMVVEAVDQKRIKKVRVEVHEPKVQ